MKPKLLERYIAKSVLSAIALVTLMLSGLQIFILFVNELGNIGQVHFGLFPATMYVLTQMPYQVYLFFPMASLLGSLIGLGVMANHRELVVMRAAGMSIWQVTKAVLKASCLLIFLVTLIGETIVPRLALMGSDLKLQALSEGQALRTGQGVWFRSARDFITIQEVQSEDSLAHVFQFRFNDDHGLQFARQIQQIHFKNGQWIAQGVSQTSFENTATKAMQVDEMPWDVALKPEILRVSTNEPDEMTLQELNQYLAVQKINHQSAYNYQLAFWQRLIQPFSTMVMMILAIPFIFGPLRSSTMGSKLLAGATVGFGFHIFNRIFGPISQVYQLPVEIAAFAPISMFIVLGIYLMRRMK